jgi:starch synthase
VEARDEAIGMPSGPDDARADDERAAAEAARAARLRTPVVSPAVVGVPPLRLPTGERVSVVHLAAELAPFARTGGLGEAVSSLAHYQAEVGLDTSIIMPLYRQVWSVAPNLEPVGEPYTVQVGPRTETARLYRVPDGADTGGTTSRRPRIYFIENAHYFERDGLYGENGQDYGDNPRRFAFFPVAALAALPRIAEAPLILHAHDWHAALAPVYLRTFGGSHPYYRRVSTVLSVHNAGFQGQYPTQTMEDIGLPWELYNWTQLEWYGKMNYLKGGLAFSDAATTVSPTHAHELRTPAGGFGLHQAFIALGARFVGIVNGIDQRVWNPAIDPVITARYASADLSGKKKCKTALQRQFGLKQRVVPIFAMSARLTYQKGLDLILGYPDYFALDAQFIFLGAGEMRYMDALREIAERAPGRIACEFNFSERLEHRLIAGADMCLMPSQYEPCGLTQMRAQRYGTIPVARRVGGLADTVEDGVTGFLFDDYTSDDFMRAAVRALDVFRDKAGWQTMVREAMGRDFGWERSELKYRELYRRALATSGLAGVGD